MNTRECFELAVTAFYSMGECPCKRDCKECQNNTLCNTITIACLMILGGEF